MYLHKILKIAEQFLTKYFDNLGRSFVVDCDFRKDTCGWKSIVENIKAQDSSQICGRGGNITNCLSVNRFNTQFTWSREKIDDIPYDQIKSGIDY